MSGLCLSVVLVLFVIFIIVSVDFITRRKISYISPSYDKSKTIEAQIRLILLKNPSSQIIVLCPKDEEDKVIIKNLCHDFPRIHFLDN